ncbi:YncE family protein, partial [Streptomyces rimosus]
GSVLAGAEERPDAGIQVIDAGTASVVGTLPTEHVVVPVHLTSTGRLLAGELRMASAPESALGRHAPGRLTVFSADSGEELGGVEVGHAPLTITSSPDGRLAYVACIASSTVDVIDLETLQLTTRLDIAKRGEAGAHGLAYIPRAA